MDSFLNPIKKQANKNHVEHALFCLNKAADILEAMGKFGASEVVTRMMEHIPAAIETADDAGDEDQILEFLRFLLSASASAISETQHFIRNNDNPRPADSHGLMSDSTTNSIIAMLDRQQEKIGKLEQELANSNYTPLYADDVFALVFSTGESVGDSKVLGKLLINRKTSYFDGVLSLLQEAISEADARYPDESTPNIPDEKLNFIASVFLREYPVETGHLTTVHEPYNDQNYEAESPELYPGNYYEEETDMPDSDVARLRGTRKNQWTLSRERDEKEKE